MRTESDKSTGEWRLGHFGNKERKTDCGIHRCSLVRERGRVHASRNITNRNTRIHGTRVLDTLDKCVPLSIEYFGFDLGNLLIQSACTSGALSNLVKVLIEAFSVFLNEQLAVLVHGERRDSVVLDVSVPVFRDGTFHNLEVLSESRRVLAVLLTSESKVGLVVVGRLQLLIVDCLSWVHDFSNGADDQGVSVVEMVMRRSPLASERNGSLSLLIVSSKGPKDSSASATTSSTSLTIGLSDRLSSDDTGILAVQNFLGVIENSELFVDCKRKDVQKILPVSVCDAIPDIELGSLVFVFVFNDNEILVFLLFGLLLNDRPAQPSQVGDKGHGMILCQPASTAVESNPRAFTEMDRASVEDDS
ncbi:hypothetical protein HG531_003638 [Fusarium graminearum]|nr:hypothetical protein HG531_003638 [Fusarium graminearum]